jgi:hypothetical protein
MISPVRRSNPFLFALCCRLPVLDKAIDQQVLKFGDPRAFLCGQKPSVLAHRIPPAERQFLSECDHGLFCARRGLRGIRGPRH